MTRFPRISQCVMTLALVSLPLVAEAQGGAGPSGATSIGLANRFVLAVGNDSTTFQKAEITWLSPAGAPIVTRQPSSDRLADADRSDADRSGPASIKFFRAASDESQKVRAWLQRGSTLEPAHVNLYDDKGKVVWSMTAPSFKIEKWSINSMDAGTSQVAVETLQLSASSLRVRGVR